MSTAPTAGPMLAELQSQFQSYVLRDAEAHPAAVVNSVGAGVYAEAYLLRHAEALSTDYPALKALLGAGEFDDLARRYTLAYPSDQFSIRWVGRHMAGFLLTNPPFCAEPYLAELAAMEWLVGEAFDAAGLPVLGVDVLRGIPPDDWAGLVLDFHPSLRRLDLRFDVVDLWKELTVSGQCPKLPVMGLARAWMIWRKDLDVLYRPLAPDEQVALDALAGRATFGDVAGQLVAASGLPEERAPALLAGWLRSWIEHGLITGAGAALNESADASGPAAPQNR